MASCKYNPGINSVNPYAVLNVTQQSQNVSTNKTVVRYELLIYRPSAISSSASKAYSITINGTKVKSGTTTIGGSGTKSIASGTLEIPHNSDGTKSISFSFSLTFDITWHGKWVGTGNANGSMTLTTIPRATTPKLNPSTQEIGKSITISLPKASSAFTHTLQHDFYAGTWTTFTTKNASTSITFTFPTSWIERIPNGVSGGGRIRCLTYNGDTLIGEKIVNFTATVPGTSVPKITNVSIVEAVSGISSKFWGYVQNQSKLKIDIKASGVSGSTIKSYKTTIDGMVYTGSSFTTQTITKSGDIDVVIEVTDSRGMTVSQTESVYMIPYEPPRIDIFTAERGNVIGEPVGDGTYALLRIKFDISPVNNRNDNSYLIEYKSNKDTNWRTLGTYRGYSYDSTMNGGNIFEDEYSYTVRLTVRDYFGDVVAEADNVPTSFTLFNINKSGQSMCFGGISERQANEKLIDFKVPIFDMFGTRVNNGMASYSGSADNGIDPDTTTDELILTDVKTPMGGMMYIRTVFYADKIPDAHRAQTAIPYDKDGATYHRYFSNGVWSKWQKHVVEGEVSNIEVVGQYGHKCKIIKWGQLCQISGNILDNRMNKVPNTSAWNAVSLIYLPSDCIPINVYQGVLITDGDWAGGIKPQFLFEINTDGNFKVVARSNAINWSSLGNGHGFAYSAVYMRRI